MNGVEIVGWAAIYVAGILACCLFTFGLSAFAFRKRGLDAVPFLIFPPIAIAFIGTIVGLVLLGRLLV